MHSQQPQEDQIADRIRRKEFTDPFTGSQSIALIFRNFMQADGAYPERSLHPLPFFIEIALHKVLKELNRLGIKGIRIPLCQEIAQSLKNIPYNK